MNNKLAYLFHLLALKEVFGVYGVKIIGPFEYI
jgi:hypothetical protein